MNVNDQMPKFNLPRDGGGEISNADFAGKNTVLFLYPRDDTPGCTLESIEFTAKKDLFAAANTQIWGLSKDSVASHEKFCSKHDLDVPLLSDESGVLVEALGAWVEKNMYGRKSMGIERSTFLIDPEGVIKNVWRKVKVDGHVDEVLAAAKAL